MKLIYDVPGDAPEYLGTAAEVAGTDEELNAALPEAAIGTIVTEAGSRNMKQKVTATHWERLAYESSPGGWVNPSDATATASDILSGKTSYIADGSKAIGTIPSHPGAAILPATFDQLVVDSGTYMTGSVVVRGDENLIAENIKKDVTIFGVTGTYEGEPEPEPEPEEAEE